MRCRSRSGSRRIAAPHAVQQYAPVPAS
jgi:hypothetical protein